MEVQRSPDGLDVVKCETYATLVRAECQSRMYSSQRNVTAEMSTDTTDASKRGLVNA